MIKPLRTSFVIADGRHARWVVRDHETGDFRTVRELHSDEKASFAYSGAVFESATGERHGGREPREPSRREAAAFAAKIAAELHDVAGRLVIVAPTRVLKAIEAELAPAAHERLAGTLPKDLTKIADHDLGRWLAPLEL